MSLAAAAFATGHVTEVAPAKGAVKVRIGEGEEALDSGWLAVVAPAWGPEAAAWFGPSEGDVVACLFADQHASAGWVLGGFAVDGVAAPGGAAEGTAAAKAKALSLNISGPVSIQASGAVTVNAGGAVSITAPSIDLN